MQNRKLAAIIFAVVLSVTLYGAYLQYARSGKTGVNITIVADTPTLTINGQKSTVGKLYLKPGTYEMKAEAAGFDSAQKTVTVGKDEVTTSFLLTPVSEAAKTWALQHNGAYLQAERQAGEETRKEGEAFTAANPITQYLPQKTSYYAINYRLDDKQQVVLQISATTPLGRQVAIEKIRSFGFDPTNYKVEFTDIKNPFTGGVQ